MAKNLSFHFKPTITRRDLIRVFETLISDRLTVEDGGNQVTTFEKNFATGFRGRNALMVVNDSAALYLILSTIGIKKGDEVLISPLAEPFVLETLLFMGVDVRCVDLKKNSVEIDLERAEAMIGEKTRALIYSYAFGFGDVEGLLAIKKKWNSNPYAFKQAGIPQRAQSLNDKVDANKIKTMPETTHSAKIAVIEDCCVAYGCMYEPDKGAKKIVGTVGDFSFFSLSSSRLFTAGKGACVLCKDKNDFLKLKALRGRGRVETPSGEDLLQARLDFLPTEIEAALANSQLSLFEKQMKRRAEIYEKFQKVVKKSWSIRSASGYKRNPMALLLLVDSHREKLVVQSAFESAKISGLVDCEHVAYFYSKKFLNLDHKKEKLTNSLDVISRLLILNFPLDITDDAVHKVVALLKTIVRISKNNLTVEQPPAPNSKKILENEEK